MEPGRSRSGFEASHRGVRSSRTWAPRGAPKAAPHSARLGGCGPDSGTSPGALAGRRVGFPIPRGLLISAEGAREELGCHSPAFGARRSLGVPNHIRKAARGGGLAKGAQGAREAPSPRRAGGGGGLRVCTGRGRTLTRVLRTRASRASLCKPRAPRISPRSRLSQVFPRRMRGAETGVWRPVLCTGWLAAIREQRSTFF